MYQKNLYMLSNLESLAKEMLLKYWNHNNFRGSQYEIIKSIVSNKDTLGLMPTGSGKSVCFQIAGIIKEGICIVISPLIALMRDQVENINKKGLTAVAINSQLTTDETNYYLEKCLKNNIKFLYLSPEKINSTNIRNIIKDMKVNLLVVDEAHCICQWGYDFRPSYLNISPIRKIINPCPILAITGSANQAMKKDIINKLEMVNPNIICDSFVRKNLHISIKNKIFKEDYLLKILNKKSVSTIIYSNSRKTTEKLSSFLNSKSIKSTFYHAGITKEEKIMKEKMWKEEKIKIMIATSAFGMGIDKPNVRLVIHWNVPSNIESYFQEIGRAGRDGIKSWCILITNDIETKRAKGLLNKKLPKIPEIKTTYNQICSYLNISHGQKIKSKVKFSLNKFLKINNLPFQRTYEILKVLNTYKIIKWEEYTNKLSEIKFNYENSDLISYMSRNEKIGQFLDMVLRKYMAYKNEFVNINEHDLASNSIYNYNTIKNYLKRLDEINVIDYNEKSFEGSILFLKPIESEKTINMISKSIIKNNNNKINQLDKVLNYISNDKECRNIQLSNYFSQKNNSKCNNCDVCSKNNLKSKNMNYIKDKITERIMCKPKSINEIKNSMKDMQEKEILNTIEFMLENSFIKYNSGKYEIS